jgi:hypothetical protein
VLGVLATLTIWWGAWELHTQKVAADAAGAEQAIDGHVPGDILEAATRRRPDQEYAQV